MPSRWIEFVREWAKKNNMTYSCALSQPQCSQEYRAKYGDRKKLPAKKEKEMMGAEDINRAKKPKKPKKPKKKIELVIEELDNGKEEDNKKRLIELSRMLGEDINRAEKVVKKAPAKKAKAPRKLPDDVIIEEEVKEKPSPEGLYARLKALQIAENAPAKNKMEIEKMMGEDINSAEKKAPAKKAKAPRKLPDDVVIEEEVKEKPSPEGLYARLKALQIAENAPAKNKMEIEKMMGEDINRAEKKAPAKKAKKEPKPNAIKSSLTELAKVLNPEMSKDGKFVKDYDIMFGSSPTWRSLRADKFKNFWLFSSLDQWIGVLKMNGKVFLFKEDEYPSKEAEKYYNDVMDIALKKKYIGDKKKYLKELYKD